VKTPELRRKPNGRWTRSVDAYVRSWRTLARPVERALGVRLAACDPDLAFDTANGQRFYLPISVAARIGEVFKGADQV
jgi:hypothetical protein